MHRVGGTAVHEIDRPDARAPPRSCSPPPSLELAAVHHARGSTPLATSRVVTVDGAAEVATLLNSPPTEALPVSVDTRLGCLGSAAPTDEVEAVDRLALTGHDTALVPLQLGQAGRLCSCDDGGWVVVDEVKIDRDVP